MTPSPPGGLDEAKGIELTTTLANLLRGRKPVVENVSALRLRVAREPEAGGVGACATPLARRDRVP